MNIDELIRRYLTEKFYYFPNPGNAGDSVIALATYVKFKELGLDYTIINQNYNVPEGAIVVLGGGGAITNEQSLFSNMLRKHYGAARVIIVLPHTIVNIDKTLKECCDKLIVCCREQVTFDYLKEFDLKELYLFEDLAFELDVNNYINGITIFDKINICCQFALDWLKIKKRDIKLKHVLKVLNEFRVTRKVRRQASITKTLDAFRLDDEKTDISITEDNLDISGIFQIGTNNEIVSQCSAKLFIASINRFDLIRTNRLHVAIVGSLLGKKVELYDNSYFKCRAVYDHTMRDRYKNTHFNSD